MAKKPKVGDPVLFVGQKGLEILEISDATGRELAAVADQSLLDARNEAAQRVQALREEQQAETEKAQAAGARDNTERWYEIAEEIKEIAKGVEPVGIVKLRTDLLEWWDDRGVWVSPGRILSNEQKRIATAPKREGGLGLSGDFDHRFALLSLESQGRA
jgi:hypothetical protein